MFDLGRRVILAAGFAVLAACARSGSPEVDVAAEKAAIKAVSLAWKNAYNAGDVAAVGALYAEDAVLSAPCMAALR